MSRPRAAAWCWTIASAIVSVATGGCGGAAHSGPPAATVTLRSLAYLPATVTIRKGQSIAWVWQDGAVPHNVDGASDLSDFDSGSLVTSGTWEHRFNKVGTYSYHCDLHPAMQGTVVVVAS